MAYVDELQNKEIQLNLVLSIEGELFSSYQVDSDVGDLLGTGIGIPTDRIGLIDKVRSSGNKTDIRNVRTSLASLSFSLIDEDAKVTALITADPEQLLEKEVTFYVGFVTGSFDFADYQLISKTYIKNIRKNRAFYQFNSREAVSLLRQRIFSTASLLSVDISDVATSLTLDDVTGFPTTGRITVNDEFMQYNGISSNTLQNLSRADLNSDAEEHKQGDQVNLVTEVEDNCIDIILQIITSGVGDQSNGIYDVLDTGGMGIPQSLVDIQSFEDARDTFFPTDDFRDYLYDIDDGLRYLEQEYLSANNIRFITKNGQISIAVLDQVDFTADVPEMPESSQDEGATWEAKSDKIVNRITFRYDFNEGLGRYVRTQVFEDLDSQALYGVKPLELKYRAIRADLTGSAIASNRATRLLARLSSARAGIKVRTQFDMSDFNIGDKVQFSNRYLPQQGGGLGMSEQLEVLSRAIDWDQGRVQFNLEFTSYQGIRVGLIAPSPLIDTVNSQTEFVLATGAGNCYRVGDVIWIDGNSGDYRTITAISGDTITIGSPFLTATLVGDRVKIAPYDLASPFQRSRYAFIVGPTGFFDDNTKGYQILF